jgi:hypothetical protein
VGIRSATSGGRRRLAVAALAIAALAASVPAALATPASADRRAQPFLRACGQAVCLSGRPVSLTAGTMYEYLDDPAVPVSLAVAGHVRMLRVTNFMDGLTDPNAWDGEQSWQRVDRIVAAAKARGLLVEIDLSAYRDMVLLGAHRDPYALDWGPMIAFMANRVNTVTGIRYRDDPTIGLVAVAGEVEPVNTPANHLKVSTGELSAFFRRTLHELAVDDPHHLHSDGGLLQITWPSGIDWRYISSLPDDQLPAIHVYDTDDLDKAIPLLSHLAAGLHKPWWVEETGRAQKVGDARRAAWLNAVGAAAARAGSAGVGVWNLGRHTGSTNFDLSPHFSGSWSSLSRLGARLESARVKA